MAKFAVAMALAAAAVRAQVVDFFQPLAPDVKVGDVLYGELGRYEVKAEEKPIEFSSATADYLSPFLFKPSSTTTSFQMTPLLTPLTTPKAAPVERHCELINAAVSPDEVQVCFDGKCTTMPADIINVNDFSLTTHNGGTYLTPDPVNGSTNSCKTEGLCFDICDGQDANFIGHIGSTSKVSSTYSAPTTSTYRTPTTSTSITSTRPTS